MTVMKEALNGWKFNEQDAMGFYISAGVAIIQASRKH